MVNLYIEKDILQFKSEVSKMNKLLEEKGITMEEAILKKQYIQICSIEDVPDQEREKSFADIAKLLDIDQDEIEEWII